MPKVAQPEGLQLLYSCKGCGLVDAVVVMPYRESAEDVIAWMEKVKAELAKDHVARSPTCTSQACDLKIPIPDGTEFIGGPVQH